MLTSVTSSNYEFIFWEVHGTFPVLNIAELKFELTSRRRAIAWWSISFVHGTTCKDFFFSWFMFVCGFLSLLTCSFGDFTLSLIKKEGWLVRGLRLLAEQFKSRYWKKGIGCMRYTREYTTSALFMISTYHRIFPHKSPPIFCNAWQKLINMKSMPTYIVRY